VAAFVWGPSKQELCGKARLGKGATTAIYLSIYDVWKGKGDNKFLLRVYHVVSCVFSLVVSAIEGLYLGSGICLAICCRARVSGYFVVLGPEGSGVVLKGGRRRSSESRLRLRIPERLNE
jgi:hypothetical protein